MNKPHEPLRLNCYSRNLIIQTESKFLAFCIDSYVYMQNEKSIHKYWAADISFVKSDALEIFLNTLQNSLNVSFTINKIHSTYSCNRLKATKKWAMQPLLLQLTYFTVKQVRFKTRSYQVRRIMKKGFIIHQTYITMFYDTPQTNFINKNW